MTKERDNRADIWVTQVLAASLQSNGRVSDSRCYVPHAQLVVLEQRIATAVEILRELPRDGIPDIDLAIRALTAPLEKET